MTAPNGSYPDTEDGPNTPDEALDFLMHEAGWTDMHGDDHHEDDCPVCRSIAIVRAGLNHAYPPSGAVAQAPPFTPELMNQTTVSCSGKEIAIQCNNHEVKDALMDILVDGAYARPSIPAQSQNNSQELTADQVAYCRENADATRARWREHAQAAPNRPPLDGEPEIDAWVRSLGWFPIDTAPKPNVDVLLWYPWIAAPRKDAPTGFAYIARWTGTDAGEDCWRDPADFEPIGEGATHWMPLPAPPSTLPSTNGGAAT